MGTGYYSHAAHAALLRKRSRLPAQEVFQQTECHPLMNPKGVKLRESRDSAAHPKSLGIVFTLDVTGSMGDIPRQLATRTLPVFMKLLTEVKLPDPQILFVAVGDANSDRAPLQVGQFESTAELMDQWLTWSYLEGGGGGHGKENYELAMYFLAMHTEMDCMVKRNQRGYCFLTGDENPYPALSRHIVEGVIGDRLDEDIPVAEVVAELQHTYHPFFLIPDRPRRKYCERQWRDLLGDHVICLEDPGDVCYASAGAILLNEGLVDSLDALQERLTQAGMPAERRAAVLQALTPFSAVALNAS